MEPHILVHLCKKFTWTYKYTNTERERERERERGSLQEEGEYMNKPQTC